MTLMLHECNSRNLCNKIKKRSLQPPFLIFDYPVGGLPGKFSGLVQFISAIRLPLF